MLTTHPEASAAAIRAATVTTPGIESNARTVAGDGPPVLWAAREGQSRSDRHDADGRGRDRPSAREIPQGAALG